MNRKKRKASGARASNPKQKNAVGEMGEMTVHDGTNVADFDEDGEQVDYIKVAQILPEKLNDFAEGGKGRPPELELRSSLNLVALRKTVSLDLSPALWRTLPTVLQSRVLARLPLSDITRLRSLSKEWNRELATANSGINQACAEAIPTIVVFHSVGNCHSDSDFFTTTYDPSTHRSQCYRLYPESLHFRFWSYMSAHDGGLVCFVTLLSPSEGDPLSIVVVNPLTRVWRKLPPLQHLLNPPQMVHIEVDSKTKSYRVVVVGENTKTRPSVEIYDSGAQQWTKATPRAGVILGDVFTFEYRYDLGGFVRTSKTPTVYDFAAGELKRCDELELGAFQGASVVACAVQKDCMFVLHKDTNFRDGTLPKDGYCITKYRIQKNGKDWVQERSYESPCEDLLGRKCCVTYLQACEGFLMACGRISDSLGNPKRYCWLLDLATGYWSSLPKCPRCTMCFDALDEGREMTRAFWNVVP